MLNYIKNFIKDSKIEIRALKDIWVPLFIYQSIIRVFIIIIFSFFYSIFIYWIVRNPWEEYIFVTGLATINYIHIDRLIVLLVFSILLFLFSFFIETFWVNSISRQYYLWKKVKLRTTFLDIIKYFKVNFKVQTLKYSYIFSDIVFVGFLIYVLYLVLPNIFWFIIWVLLIIKNTITIVNKIVEYKDVWQRVFEGRKNIFEIYNYNTSKKRKKRIIKYYALKMFLLVISNIFLPVIWLYTTYIICKISLNYDVFTSILLGLNSTLIIFIAACLSYLYISFFTLRATRKYLELKEEKTENFKKYSKKGFSNYKFFLFILFVSFTIFQSLFFYDYFHANVVKEKKVTIFAHRASMMWETNNSLEALDYSIKNKVEFVEIDVQLSKEWVPIVFHDYTYFDWKQKKYVQNTYLEELKKFDLKVYKNINKLKKEQIPTLEEFLLKAKWKIKVNIEIKTTKNFEIELAEKVAEIIKKLNMQNEIIVSSFEYKILKKIKEIIPEIKTGLIITAYIGKADEIWDMDVDWLMVNNIYYYIYEDSFSDFEDKKIALWSFSSNFSWESVIYQENINGAIVNDPVKLKDTIKRYNSLSVWEKYYKQIERFFGGVLF